MRKIIIQVCAISLDGVIQTDGTEFETYLEQIPEDHRYDQWIADSVGGADVLFVGRNTYLGMADYFSSAESDPMVDALNHVPKIVLSNTLTSADWGPVTVASGGLSEELDRVRRGGDGYALVQGGVTLLQAIAAQDAADEYWLAVCPYVAGSGPQLFANDGSGLNLEVRSVEPLDNGIVAMCYRRLAGAH
jgi:dihydrofolate reductase